MALMYQGYLLCIVFVFLHLGHQLAQAVTTSSQYALWQDDPSWNISSGCAASVNIEHYKGKSEHGKPVHFVMQLCDALSLNWNPWAGDSSEVSPHIICKWVETTVLNTLFTLVTTWHSSCISISLHVTRTLESQHINVYVAFAAVWLLAVTIKLNF